MDNQCRIQDLVMLGWLQELGQFDAGSYEWKKDLVPNTWHFGQQFLVIKPQSDRIE